MILLQAENIMAKESIEELEKDLSEKTNDTVVIIPANLKMIDQYHMAQEYTEPIAIECEMDKVDVHELSRRIAQELRTIKDI